MRGNLLLITHWSFKDALIQTYTLPYLEIIRSILPKDKKIFLLTSEQGNLALSSTELKNINNHWAAKNIELIALPYERFSIRKLIAMSGQMLNLIKLIRDNRIAYLHSFCSPAGGMAYILSKLTGVPIVADSYEPHAEVMVENGTWTRNGLANKILSFLELRLARRASYFIGTTAAMNEYAKSRYNTTLKNLFVKPACINFNDFHPQSKDLGLLKKYGLEGKTVAVYAGKLGGIYLKEEVFDFVKACYNHWGENFQFLMLTNAPKEEIDAQIKRIDIPSSVVLAKFCLHHEVSRHLALGDFALNPVKPGPSRRYCTSIKDGEYWATGLPVVITKDISDDSDIILENNIGAVLEALSTEEYNKAISKISMLLREPREQLSARVFDVGKKYRSFSIAEKIYSHIYGTLLN